MMYKYENGSMIERCAMGIEGNPIRSEEWEKDGFGYYKMCPIMNEFNDLIAFVVTNEFYEECAFYDPYSEQALKTNYIKMSFSRVEMPHNLTIKMKQVRPTAPKHCYVYTNDAANNISNQMVAYLHIKSKSSELYKSGLKDGDRIICIDNWKYSASMQGFESAWESLYNQGKHVIKVMRPKDKQSFEPIEREVPQLTTSKGYKTERAYSYMLTTAEQQRFNNFLNYSK